MPLPPPSMDVTGREAGLRAPGLRAPGLRAQAAFLACIAAVCLLIIGLDAWRSWNARATEVSDTKVETANLARSLAQHVHDLLASADTLLVSLRDNVERGSAAPEQRRQLHQMLAGQIATVSVLRDLMVIDVLGDRIVSATEAAPVPENLRDRAYFQYHAANRDRGVYFGDPVQGKLSGTWIVTLSRRVDDAGGAFAGVVVATFAVSAIQAFHQTFDVGKEGFIGLSTTGGVIISRVPYAGVQTGHRVTTSVVYNDLLPVSPIGDLQSVSPLDGTEHLESYRKVEPYPLVIIVGRGLAEALTSWRRTALTHLAISLSASCVIAILGLRFAGQLRAQRRAEWALQQRERQYRLLADNNTDLIVQIGADLRFVYASPASQSLLGYPPDALVGAHPQDFAHADDWPALSQNLATLAQGGIAAPISYRALRRDGTEIWVEAAGRRLAGAEGFIFVKRDITERRSAELQLRQAQRMEAVGQLTAGVAHDFNNLLQVQLGSLELLLKDVAGQPKAIRLARLSIDAAQRAAKLTHSLLSFSRKQMLDPETVSLPALFARLQTMLSRTLGPRVILQMEVDHALPPVFVDPAQIEAALVNLALNARDAMPDGGRLTIVAGDGRAVPLLPATIETGRHVLITVSDTGVGMSAATLAHACEPFFTTKEVGKGSGLGLSMVQGFARQSGGALRFTSAPGEGTRAELWLPVAAAAVASQPGDAFGPSYGQGRVLLVDDVGEILQVMAEGLQAAGFEVVAVGSGEAALHALADGRGFDALVTDFAMPGIDGGELTHRARRIKPQLPIIVITGYADSDRLSRLPDDVVTFRKPVEGDMLARRLCALLNTARTRRPPGVDRVVGARIAGLR